MNGQLNDHPLVELIREIAAKNISGRLQLELEKFKVAVYFKSGRLTFAACNVKSFRIGTYLVQSKLVSEEDLRYLGSAPKDFDLLRTLVSEKRISEAQARQLQTQQVTEVLRLALQWKDGTWSFDPRSRLDEEVTVDLDIRTLQLDAARRLPAAFVSSRFKNPGEVLNPESESPARDNLTPGEVFLLSRLQASMTLSEFVAVSGLKEQEALQTVYILALGGFLKRGFWKSSFRNTSPQPGVEAPEPVVKEVEPEKAVEPDPIEVFLGRLASTNNYYEILLVGPSASTAELKQAYYNFARKYHPDHFRSSPATLLERVESAFARITQAYDTLTDTNLRAAYDSKLEAKARLNKLADTAPKAAATEQLTTSSGPEKENVSILTPAQQAEVQFREGFAALELGQRHIAIGLLGSAARAVPTEPRYRAYYGRALSLDSSTRRIAEVELQAALKIEPNNTEYRIMLAELYRDLGFLVRAKSEAERAVAADGNNRRARDLLNSLK